MRHRSIALLIAVTLSACSGGGGTVTPSAAVLPNGPAAGEAPLVLSPPGLFSIVDLGAHVDPEAINAHGVIVGKTFAANPGGAPFRYENGALTILPLPQGGTIGDATDVNDSGLAVGVAGDAIEWQPGGTMHDLGAPADSFVTIAVVDNAGEVLGLSVVSGIAGCGGALMSFSTTAPPVNVGPDQTSLARSDAGLAVIGEYEQQGPACEGTMQPALYPSFTAVPVPPQFTLVARSSAVSDVNAGGAVIGYGPTTLPTGTGPTATFFAHNGHSIEIAPPSGYDTLIGYGLNDADWIVGTLQLQSTQVAAHAFVWINGKTVDLNKLVPAGCSWVLNSATDVNNAGEIVGIGTYNGVTHGFLLVPQH